MYSGAIGANLMTAAYAWQTLQWPGSFPLNFDPRIPIITLYYTKPYIHTYTNDADFTNEISLIEVVTFFLPYGIAFNEF